MHERGMLLEVMKILSANGDSGMLEITAGTTQGVFFFKNGQLVDARVGDLKGFPAVNAAASILDARFTFDPSAVPPVVSSITPNERIVLKQFFGVETFHPDNTQQSEVVSGDEEVTIETNRIPVETLPHPVSVSPSPTPFYRVGLLLAVLFCLIAVSAVVLRNKYRERAQPASVATTAGPSVAPAVAEEPIVAKEPVKTNDSTTPVAGNDLTGRWNVVNTVQKTSFRTFEHLKIGFDLSISQNGNSFTGTGKKVSENGRSLPAASRTPIQVKGVINGDRVEATFSEDGALRKTSGRFVWQIDRKGGLNGTFVSSAAQSSGKSAARKS